MIKLTTEQKSWLIAIVYVISLIFVSLLSFEQGQYTGMKEICGEQVIYEVDGELVCRTGDMSKKDGGFVLNDNYKT